MSEKTAAKPKKKETWEKPRHRVAFAFARLYFRVFGWWKMGYTTGKTRLEKGKGHLIVCNHQSLYDAYLISMCFNRPIYVMAGDYMFNTGKPAERLVRWFAPIPKVKAGSDPASMINTMRILREGSVVCIFPEASRTYDGRFGEVPASMGRFIKKVKVPVTVFNLQGGYGADPRWCRTQRRGHFKGVVRKTFSVEELSAMTEDQIVQELDHYLRVDETKTEYTYKSKSRAEYLERLLYACPKCGAFSTLYSEGSHIMCKSCGLKAEYTERTTFEFENFDTDITTTADWVDWQDAQLAQFDEAEGVIFSDENAHIETCDRNVLRQNLGRGRIEIDREEMRVVCPEKTFAFKHDEYTVISPIGWTKILFTTRHGSFMINGTERFNPYKYVKLIYHFTGNPDQVR